MAYRIDKLGNHPMRALGWARLTCVILGVRGAEERLDHVEHLYHDFEAKGEMPVWSLLDL